jgi:hypothetical protein
MPALLTYLPCTGSAFGGRCLMIAIIGMLAGYSCLPGSWLHDPWLILSSLVCARFLSFPVSRSFWPVWTFLGWMTLRSVFSAGNEWALGLAGVSLLVLALMWMLLMMLVTKPMKTVMISVQIQEVEVAVES